MQKKKQNRPPVIARWILTLFRSRADHESLIGDYDEMYRILSTENGTFKANMWFRLQLIKTIPSFISNSLYWKFAMLKNYLKITVRTLMKYKSFSALNIFGLALSMALCLMIIIFIRDQKSSDNFHDNADRIVRVYTTDTEFGWDVDGWATTPGFLGEYLKVNYDVIEDAVTLRRMWGNALIDGTGIPVSGLYAGPSFFSVFSYHLVKGDPQTALREPYSIILSEKTARTLFGNTDPMNQPVEIEPMGIFTVKGILHTQEQKSHLVFEALVSLSTVFSLENNGFFTRKFDRWQSFNRYYTFALLKHKNDFSLLKRQLAAIESSVIPKESQNQYGLKLQKLADINLGINLSNKMPGSKPWLDVFFIPFLAALVMLLACFNYVILSVARSLKRAREIGIRRVIGAKREQVIKLFFCETASITFLALLTACILIMWFIPIYNGIDAVENTEMQINIALLKEPLLYVVFLIFACVVSIVAGIYPALYLSSLLPVNALKGVTQIGRFSHLKIRKLLMSAQFAVSLISVIFIVYFFQLYSYWMTLEKGFEPENIVNFSIRNINPETFKNEFSGQPNIMGVSLSSNVPVFGGKDMLGVKTEGRERLVSVYYYNIDTQFLSNFRIELLAGRNFREEFATDAEDAIILNEKAVRRFALGTPAEAVGKTITFSDNRTVSVIGVVKDFTFRTFENPIEPLILRNKTEQCRIANIRYVSGKEEEVKATVTEVWKKLDKIHTASFSFFNTKLNDFHNNIKGTIKIAAAACGFVILISLFGLLGMTMYTTELKIKEVGIRKTLGASTSAISFLLAKEYIRLIVYSAVIALPAGYFGADALFQFFAFRPGLSLLVPPAAFIFILVLALITIGSQTVKAARINPVTTLKEE